MARPFSSSRSHYTALWLVAGLGLALHLAGLGWDVYLHSRDSTLAAREGVITLKNPSHVLIFAGVGLITGGLLGVAWLWLSERAFRGVAGAAVRFAAIPAVAIGAAGAIAVASLARDSAHEHTGGHPEGSAVAAAGEHGHPADPASPMAEGNAHFHSAEVRVTEEQLRAALAFVDRVKAHVAQFADVRAGLAAGYIQATQDLEGIAAHFVHPAYLRDGREMDPEHPEVLLYSKRLDGTWRLLGVMFQSAQVGGEAPNYFGGLDAWHYHTDLCFGLGGVRVVKAEADCAGLFTKQTGWELHVWTEPGAEGPFAHDYAPISPGAFPGATRSAAAEVGRVQRP
ncbi:MAG: hypothetical protein ACKVVT_15680 [Dehalococcoidia bacterium]